MTSRTIPAHMRCSTPAHLKLRSSVAAILAGVPINVADHADGIGLVMHDVVYARMVAEGAHESSATRKPPSWHAVPAHVRASIAKSLNKAIADSGLRAFDAWGDAIYGPLIEIEKGIAS